MSKFVKVNTELRDLAMVKQALDDLKYHYKEDGQFTHRWSGYSGSVPLLVQHQGVSFGLREAGGGHYEIIGDDLQLRTIQEGLNRIQQRYAYHKVLAEVQQAGFSLVEEETDQSNVIRMTVRRWR